ncbi:PH domain-containing protein [Actinomyces faecalis]|uniref:PH domain-containing protein n=1 Tax=Actinomyces faecalis TaxID=2722820 RepID=UPI0015526F46|nr:PH domain-containing protein [Actinomyces faecalis]
MTASRPTEPTVPDSGRPSDTAAVSPFEPEGVEFHPVSPTLITARLALNLGFDAVLIVVFLVLGVVHDHWWFLGAGLVTATTLWESWLIPRQVRAMGYALGEDHLLWRKGIMFRRISVVPYGRMQFVDTSQGPLARHLGIAEVKLHTASASTDATINGLPVAEAEHLRQLLSERGEERMSGL